MCNGDEDNDDDDDCDCDDDHDKIGRYKKHWKVFHSDMAPKLAGL
jgi:hypothetical protein